MPTLVSLFYLILRLDSFVLTLRPQFEGRNIRSFGVQQEANLMNQCESNRFAGAPPAGHGDELVVGEINTG